MTEETLYALEIGSLIYSLATKLPQDISIWTINRDHLPGKLNLFQEKLGILTEQLESFSRALSSAEEITDLQEISEITANLNKRLKKRRCFPLPLKPICSALRQAEIKHRELRDSMNQLAQTITVISNETITTPVWRVPVVPNSHYIDIQSNSTVKTIIGNTLKDDPNPIGAILVGSAGVGKTTAVCQIARDNRIRARFIDGVFFCALGEDVTTASLINEIARIVRLLGRDDIQNNIQQIDDIEEAVTEAAICFTEKKCLIIFDNVWKKAFGSIDIISALSLLSTNGHCKLIFTTRDSIYLDEDHTSDVAVLMKKRNIEESENILLQSASLERPEEEKDLYIFNLILKEADGLPLLLRLTGKALRELNRGKKTKLSIWCEYEGRKSQPQSPKKTNSNIPASVQDGFLSSIKLIEEQTKNIKYWEYFRALSVVQNTEGVPYRVFYRIFGESQSEGRKIIESFENYNIISVNRDGHTQNDSNSYVFIHDSVLDLARELADQKGESARLVMRWLSSFRVQENDNDKIQLSFTEGSLKEMWPSIEDDLDNYVCRNVVAILKRASMFDEVLCLINEPWWIQKQLNSNGLHQVRSDLEISLQCIAADDKIQQADKEILRKWVKLLNAAITSSYEAVSKSEWDGMAYTQLYGRLQTYRQASREVEDFLKKIKECKSVPLLLPKAGSFPAVSSLFREKIKNDGSLLVSRQISHYIHTVLSVPLDDTKDKFKNRLMLKVNDISKSGSVVKQEEILKTESSINSGRMTEDGNLIVFGTDEGYVILVENIETGETQDSHDLIPLSGAWKSTILHGHKDCVRSVAISGKGGRIISGSDDHTVCVWEITNDQWSSKILRGHDEWVTSVAITTNGNRIISGSNDGTVHVWDMNNQGWNLSTVLRGNDEWVNSVAIHGNGNRIVSGLNDGALRVWDIDNNGQWMPIVIRGHKGALTSVAISRDENYIVSGSLDKIVRIWNVANGEVKSTVLQGHKSSVMLVTISGDRRSVVSGSLNNTVHVWDLDSSGWDSTTHHGHEGAVTSVAISVDGMRIVSGSLDKTVRVRDMSNDEQDSTILCGHQGSVMSVAISANKNRIVSGSLDSMVHVWDLDDGSSNPTILRGHGQWVKSVAVSGDGKRIVSGSYNSTVRVWDVRTNGWDSTVLRGQEYLLTTVAISSDGRRIVSGSDDQAVRVWDIRNGRWRQPAIFRLNEMVKFVEIFESINIIRATTLSNETRWWRLLSSGWWTECSEPEGVPVIGTNSFSTGSAHHARLLDVHRQAMGVLRTDLNMNNMACTAKGYVIWGKGEPFIGFIDIFA